MRNVADDEPVDNSVPVEDTVSVDDNLAVEHENENVITVQINSNTQEKRKWDKKYLCIYCHKYYSKLPRHVLVAHKDETEIIKINDLKKGSKERSKALDVIRSKGLFLHNREVHKAGVGEIIPKRRPKCAGGQNFLPCTICLNFFHRENLWRHRKVCSKANKTTCDKQHVQSGAALLPSAECSDLYKKNILDKLRVDEVSVVAKHDTLITEYGNGLFKKYRFRSHQHQYIREKIRALARLVLQIRKIDGSNLSLREYMYPAKYKLITEAAQKVCGYDNDTGTFESPATATKLGTALKTISDYLATEGIEADSSLLQKRGQDMKLLFQFRWSKDINLEAAKTLEQKKYNNPKRIPLTEDVRLLNLLLQDKATSLASTLASGNATQQNVRELTEVTLALVTLFNRRRGGEAERLTKTVYQLGLKAAELNSEYLLSKSEKHLQKLLTRIEIPGKRGRAVPILLPKSHKSYVDLILQHRGYESDFVFARSEDATTAVRTSDVLRKYSGLCGAKCPELLRSTALRKHIATISQLMNLKDNELDLLAQYLGHDISVHREFYRLPNAQIQLAKLAKLLMFLDQAEDLQQLKGKSLDDIEVKEDGE